MIKNNPFKDFETPQDITHSRVILLKSLPVFKNSEFQLKLFEFIQDYLEKENELNDETAQNLLSFFSRIDEFVDAFKKGLIENKYKIDINQSFLTELFFILSSNSNDIKEIDRVYKMFIRREKTLTEKEKDDSCLNYFNDDTIYIFAISLRQTLTSDIFNFLNHHNELFAGNFHEYLDNILIEYDALFLDKTKLKIKEWADNTSAENREFDTQMEWLGTQKQLGELFVTLLQKGYIKEIEPNKIKSAFSNSNSIQQVLKPSYDKIEKVFDYDQIFSKRYSPKFDLTKPRKKSKANKKP